MVVFWDWNGTLLDDVGMTVELNNEVFRRFGYREMGLEEHREMFRFPVIDYYEMRGVPRERYAELAQVWMDGYVERVPGCALMDDAVETLRRFREAGHRQIILSATKIELLREQVGQHPCLDGFFEELLGIGDIYAGSKVHIARAFMERGGVRAEDAVFLGDTCHDAETADAIGCRCLLIPRGHQSRGQLERAGKPIFACLKDAADYLLENRS